MYSRLFLGFAFVVTLVLTAVGLLIPLGADSTWVRLFVVLLPLGVAAYFGWLLLGVRYPSSRAGAHLALQVRRIGDKSSQSLFMQAAFLTVLGVSYLIYGFGYARRNEQPLPYLNLVLAVVFVLQAVGLVIEGRRSAREHPIQTRFSPPMIAIVAALIVAVIGILSLS